MLEGFLLPRILMTAESGLNMFLDILSNNHSRNRHKRSGFNIKLYPFYLIIFVFFYFSLDTFQITPPLSSDPPHAFILAPALLSLCYTSMSMSSVLLLVQRTLILIQKGGRRIKRGFLSVLKTY